MPALTHPPTLCHRPSLNSLKQSLSHSSFATAEREAPETRRSGLSPTRNRLRRRSVTFFSSRRDTYVHVPATASPLTKQKQKHGLVGRCVMVVAVPDCHPVSLLDQRAQTWETRSGPQTIASVDDVGGSADDGRSDKNRLWMHLARSDYGHGDWVVWEYELKQQVRACVRVCVRHSLVIQQSSAASTLTDDRTTLRCSIRILTRGALFLSCRRGTGRPVGIRTNSLARKLGSRVRQTSTSPAS